MAQEMSKPHLFLVDDETDLVLVTSLVLTRLGYPVHSYYDGPSALVAAEALRPDAILLDIGMHPIDGYEVCRRLRAQAWGQTVAIIALTGYGQAADVAQAEEAGFDAHLLKPVGLDRLVEEIRSCVNKRSAA